MRRPCNSALHPELGLAGPVVGALDVPVLPLWVVIHRRHEIKRCLELDVVEARLRGEQLMPLAGGNQHQAAGADGQGSGVVLHLAGSLLDEVEVLRGHRARFRRLMHVAW